MDLPIHPVVWRRATLAALSLALWAAFSEYRLSSADNRLALALTCLTRHSLAFCKAEPSFLRIFPGALGMVNYCYQVVYKLFLDDSDVFRADGDRDLDGRFQ